MGSRGTWRAGEEKSKRPTHPRKCKKMVGSGGLPHFHLMFRPLRIEVWNVRGSAAHNTKLH